MSDIEKGDGSPIEPSIGGDTSRPCTRCGRYPTQEGHDACLGRIEGVTTACCGHGVERALNLAGDLGIDLNEYIKRAVAGFNKRMRDYLSR